MNEKYFETKLAELDEKVRILQAKVNELEAWQYVTKDVLE